MADRFQVSLDITSKQSIRSDSASNGPFARRLTPHSCFDPLDNDEVTRLVNNKYSWKY